jgi:serine/threonine protein kinase
MIFNLFTILTNNSDYQINKQILTILSAFALNDDSNILIRMNWLEVLLKLLINYSFRLREESSTLSDKEKSLIIINQTLIVRILRLIFSLEKNRKYFKQLFPTKLLSMFIDIGNYKHSLNLYTTFITELNSLTDEDLSEIQIKCENITGMSNEANNINQTVGGYSIVELIGKGGFGSVYKVKINNQYFAMKEIKLEEKELRLLKGNTSTKNIEKVISEIEIWKDLDHPNIIRYYTSFMEKDKNNVYIIMELVEGVNLSEYMSNLREKGAKPKEKEIIKLLIDVVCGLKYLHKEKGVLYRDVNPHNIMIDNNFNVKMGDFGLAKKLKRENEENMLDADLNNLSHSMSSGFVGSILYSSPEMIKNENYTEKSDLWSLGCVLYELLNFSAPFEGDNPLTVAKNIVELNYKRLNMNDFEHPVLVNIIKRCLVPDPEERIDINEMCGYLGPYFADKINFFKRSEYELKNENDYLNEKIYKLETAFANLTSNGNGNVINEQGTTTTQGVEFASKKNSAITISKFHQQSKTDVFKQSTFKRISDPLTKILEMINKIMFLTSEGNIRNPKDEKFTFITKFKRKLFLSNGNLNNSSNAHMIKSEIMKLINFSKETINFEAEDREVPFNTTGMKGDLSFKTRITYELMYHFIEELLILNNYY